MITSAKVISLVDGDLTLDLIHEDATKERKTISVKEYSVKDGQGNIAMVNPMDNIRQHVRRYVAAYARGVEETEAKKIVTPDGLIGLVITI